MSNSEFYDHNIPPLPSAPNRITPAVISSARKEGAIDRQYTYRRLQFVCSALDLLEQPKLFTVHDAEQFTRSTVLTVPSHTPHLAARQLFVAVNSESSGPSDDGFDMRHMTQFAYRWSIDGNRISRSDATTATRPATDSKWTYNDEFGPFVVQEGEFVRVLHWEPDRLPALKDTIGRLSIRGLAELKVAEDLIARVQSLTPANEIDNVQLISEEL